MEPNQKRNEGNEHDTAQGIPRPVILGGQFKQREDADHDQRTGCNEQVWPLKLWLVIGRAACLIRQPWVDRTVVPVRPA